MKNMLGVAIAITAEAFRTTTDKGGNPYMLHCLEVMNGVRHLGEDVMCIGVMHDLIEDTHYELDDLRSLGFNERVVNGIKDLTHDKDISYEDYIKKLSFNEDARQVKMKDLEHNSNITRMKGVSRKDFTRIEKYHVSHAYLSKV